jgi:hypothetical protein
MYDVRMSAFALLIAVSNGVLYAPAVMAQSSDASAASAHSKTTAKAQRKADRKAARTKKNAELKDLEKNGYQPGGGDQLNYPQNLQDAEKKSATSKAKAASSQ